MRFLFYLEREFHISLFRNLIEYIYNNTLGEIGIYSFAYTPSEGQKITMGIRKEIIDSYVADKYAIVTNPRAYAPDITFLADSSYEAVEGVGFIVNIGHGTISKGSFFTENLISRRENAANLLCLPGVIHKQVLKKNVYIPMEVTGMPKLDTVFSLQKKNQDKPSGYRQELLKQMKLSLSKTTILFAPTFNKEFSLVYHTGAELRKYIPVEYNLIIKLHGVAPEEWKTAFRSYALHTPDTYYSDDYDISSCFLAADLMISDMSSVIYEFLALNKPVILFDSPDSGTFRKFNPLDIEYKFRDVGLRFSHPADISLKIEKSLKFPADNKNVSAQFIGVRDSSSSKKVLEFSLEHYSRKKLKGCIIILDTNPVQTAFLKERYQNQFEVIIHSDPHYEIDTLLYTNIWDMVKREILKTKQDNIVVMDSSFNYSSLFPLMMLNHLRYNDPHGLVVPLQSNKLQETGQTLSFHLPEASKLPEERVGVPLTYNCSGQFKYIRRASLRAFAFNKINFVPSGLTQHQYLLALDCFVF